MLLKRLKLRNIRTYENWEVTFPMGMILFEGGIGSGKSTLLLAVEFALFGLGNERGTTLLSLGKNEGEVELIFEAKGQEMRVHRSLVRTKRGAAVNQGALVAGGVKQDDCWIDDGERRVSYSPKEMKEAVLKILGYNEPVDPKAKSVIFRYAVYTPQEEMKDILAQAPEQRLQTIRKALRLEDYKVARDNSHMVAKELVSRSRFLMEGAKKLTEIEEELKDLEDSIPEIGKEVKEIEESITDIEVELKGHKMEREELRGRLEALAGEARREVELSSSLKDTIRRISSLTSGISSNKEKVAGLRVRIEDITKNLKKPDMTIEEAEGKLTKARDELDRCTRSLGTISHIFSSYSTLVEKKVCPTCNQRVDTEEFKSRLEASRGELDKTNAEKTRLEVVVRDLEGKRQAAVNHSNDMNSLTGLEDRLYDAEDQISKDEEELGRTEAQKEELEEKVKEAAKAAMDYKAVKVKFDENEGEIEALERRRKELDARKTGKDVDLRNVQTKIKDLKEEKAEIEAKKAKAESLTEYAAWLDEYFSIALERIELTILTTANREFDEEFGRWFSFMVEDPTKSVRIDEGFTPLITQDAYEQEVSNLSGGERTALALAYRLALNKTVQRRSGVESGLLILDEPTDGFSKDQIGKIGDLLKELNLIQAIIVSHERELEGAVDHIFRVQKEDGKSKVLPVST
jgi:exonuclease SbcC